MTDLEIIKNPDKWPCWPFLPLKNTKTKKSKTGFLIDDGERLTIHHIVLFISSKKYIKIPPTKYVSHEAIIRDGWIIG